MATKDGRTQIWYADGNGNVEGYTETVGDIAETIIGAYNEHFGTDIQLWTPETKNLQVGGTVPNWNAYEKIYAPVPEILLIKNKVGEQYILARYSEKTLEIACGVGTSTLIVVDNQGVVVTVEGPPFDNMKNNFEGLVEHAGYDVETTSIWEVSINVGDTMENWDSYITL